MAITLLSTLTCPHCQGRCIQAMPTNACQWFFQCPHCQVLLKPLAGDCCVFCSYGDVKCPPIQQDLGCCHASRN